MQATETSQDEQSAEQKLEEVEQLIFECINDTFDKSLDAEKQISMSKSITDEMHEIVICRNVPISSTLLSDFLEQNGYELWSLLVSSSNQCIVTVTDE